jgi:hypothetical protein
MWNKSMRELTRIWRLLLRAQHSQQGKDIGFDLRTRFDLSASRTVISALDLDNIAGYVFLELWSRVPLRGVVDLVACRSTRTG